MFGKDNKLMHHHLVNIIQHHTVINGDVECNGDLRLDGIIKGNLKISGRLVMGAEAKIEGAVECENAEISGKIKGDLKVKGTLHLKKNCFVEGDIYTKKLIVESDAVFNGKCFMNTTDIDKKQVTEKTKVATL
jgi:cytoskeletal protein CcmA (bactofilin family)